jgi:hypothetical protein
VAIPLGGHTGRSRQRPRRYGLRCVHRSHMARYRIADSDEARAADLPALLLTLPARTPEGLQAKAAAVLAISDATAFTGDCREDEIELLRSVVLDAAGEGYRDPTVPTNTPKGENHEHD